MADNLPKKPAKGILKNSSSFDRQETQAQAKKNKETSWDEMNIIATLHPPDKDYGHMKIEEPKTPYSYGAHDELDAAALTEKLATERPAKVLEESEEDEEEEEEELTPEEQALKREFEMKRKAHYNEYYAVKLARKLLEEEDDEEDEDDSLREQPQVAGDPSTADRPSCSRNCNLTE